MSLKPRTSPDPNSPTPSQAPHQTSPETLRHTLQHQAREYLSSNPGPDNLSKNVAVHYRFRRFLKDPHFLDKGSMTDLLEIVTYRLSVLHQADEYAEIMGINLPSIKECDVHAWHLDREQSQEWNDVMGRLVSRKLFEKPAIYPQ